MGFVPTAPDCALPPCPCPFPCMQPVVGRCQRTGMAPVKPMMGESALAVEADASAAPSIAVSVARLRRGVGDHDSCKVAANAACPRRLASSPGTPGSGPSSTRLPPVLNPCTSLAPATSGPLSLEESAQPWLLPPPLPTPVAQPDSLSTPHPPKSIWSVQLPINALGGCAPVAVASANNGVGAQALDMPASVLVPLSIFAPRATSGA